MIRRRCVVVGRIDEEECVMNDEANAQWLVNAFSKEPFKYAKKRAGGSARCFPIIHAITSIMKGWSDLPGMKRAAKMSIKLTIRIIEQGIFFLLFSHYTSLTYIFHFFDLIIDVFER